MSPELPVWASNFKMRLLGRVSFVNGSQELTSCRQSGVDQLGRFHRV